MTIKELIEKGTPIEKYKYLDNIWWNLEGLLANLLPDGYEGELSRDSIYSDFQALRYRIHDVFSMESRKTGKEPRVN